MNDMSESRPRYAMVRAYDHNQPNALYDIVDYIDGAEQIVAQRVLYQPAKEIVRALNDQDRRCVVARQRLRQFLPAWRAGEQTNVE